MKKRKRLLFASVMVVITLLNCCYIRFALTADLVSDALTIVSIVYGLAVTAICNLYGRKITRKMWHTASHKNESQSQLHDLIDDFSSLFRMLGLLAVMSIVFYVFDLQNPASFSWVPWFENDQVIYVYSGMYIAVLIGLLETSGRQLNNLLTLLTHDADDGDD